MYTFISAWALVNPMINRTYRGLRLAGPSCPLPLGDGGPWLVLSLRDEWTVLSRWSSREAADRAAFDQSGAELHKPVAHLASYLAVCRACGVAPLCA